MTAGDPTVFIIEHGRNVLVHHFSTQLQERQGKALTNFSRTLPPEDWIWRNRS
jgi:hypothetical protein